MRKALLVVVAVALVGAVAFAAAPAKGTKVNLANPAGPGQSEAPQTIDYWGAGGSSFYTWSGNFYMSNLFKPDAGWYPLDVTSLDVLPASLDSQTASGAAGVLNGVGVFSTAGAVLARELNVNATVSNWVNVPLTTVPRIAAGNFYGGLWNSAVSGGPTNDGGLQTTASNWTAPPTEPFQCLNGTAVNAAGPYTASNCGDTYTTVSAASVIANVNTNVPVELMRFDAQ